MILSINKVDTTQAALIAIGEDDEKVLQYLFDNHICFGFYRLSHYMPDLSNEGQYDKVLSALRIKGIDVRAVGYINEVKGYVLSYSKSEIPKKENETINPKLSELYNFMENQ